MRITESQLRKAVRQQIASILREEEEQNPQMGAPVGKQAPEEEPEEEQGPSKGTMLAQKFVEKMKHDSELTSAESITDMLVVFLNSMNFSSETKLEILRNAKTETVH